MLTARTATWGILWMLSSVPVVAGPCHEWARETPVHVAGDVEADDYVEWDEADTRNFLAEILRELGRPLEAYDLENGIVEGSSTPGGPRWFLRSRSPLWPSLAIEGVGRTSEGCLIVQASWWGDIAEALFEVELKPMARVVWMAGRELWLEDMNRSCRQAKAYGRLEPLPEVCEEVWEGRVEYQPSWLDYVVTETPAECAVLGLEVIRPDHQLRAVAASDVPAGMPSVIVIPSQEELARRKNMSHPRGVVEVRNRRFWEDALENGIPVITRAGCEALVVFPKDPATGRCKGEPMTVIKGKAGTFAEEEGRGEAGVGTDGDTGGEER